MRKKIILNNSPDILSVRAKDMDIILAVANDRLWTKCCQAFEWIDLSEDARFETNAKRVAHRQELINIMSERLITMESIDIFEKMDHAGVPCGPIHTIDQVLNHPQDQAREMMIEIEHPNVKNLKVPGFPVKLSDTPSNVRRHPPLLGEHTDEVLGELGYTRAQIENLKKCECNIIPNLRHSRSFLSRHLI
ncbi:CoA transferase [Neobacillus cucumis]|uniref:CoA transferase n=1 Tax=Neobacillus cucumis TaxID=1740721 RepID=UPI00203A4D9B|nr:CoA transferase [Neobacillus cucumis]MCM3729502.1 CoA transferase [Neobacillus cucumis]